MKTININGLPKKPFSYQESLELGLTEYALRKLLDQGLVERLSRGVYQVSELAEDLPEDQYRAATLRCGLPSSVCLLSALDHYNLTDQIPKRVWLLVPNSKRIRAKELKLIRSRCPKWKIGIRKTKGYWITTIERTLVDCLVFKRIIGSQVALSALRQALSEKKVKLSDIYNIAKRMDVEKRIHSYIEALA